MLQIEVVALLGLQGPAEQLDAIGKVDRIGHRHRMHKHHKCKVLDLATLPVLGAADAL